MLHGLGFAMPCTKGVQDGAHMGSGILARGELQFLVKLMLMILKDVPKGKIQFI